MTAEQKQSIQQLAVRTFEHDLPHLCAERFGQWIAYHGDQQLGFSTQKHELYQQCLQMGLARDEFVVFCIEPQETEMVFGPVIMD